jgi:maleylpyruvate isomerase
MRLYGYWRASSPWRVRIALEHKGVSYEYIPVNLAQGEQLGAPFAEKNPLAQLPVLEIMVNGRLERVTQSLAIIELLEELHPTPALLPKDPVQRARARQYALTIASGIQPFQNPATHKEVKALGGDERAWTQTFMRRGLAALESEVRQTAGTYMVGEAVSIADVCLAPQLYAVRRFDVDVAAYPTLARIETAVAALPAFQRAHADRQIDAPKK